jgi:hypothetical protein
MAAVEVTVNASVACFATEMECCLCDTAADRKPSVAVVGIVEMELLLQVPDCSTADHSAAAFVASTLDRSQHCCNITETLAYF